MAEVLSHHDSHKMRCLSIPTDLKSSIIAQLAEDPNTSPDQSLQTSPISSRPASPPPKSEKEAINTTDVKSKPVRPTAVRSRLANVENSEDLEKETSEEQVNEKGAVKEDIDGEELSPMRTHELSSMNMEPVAQKVSGMVTESDSDTDDFIGDSTDKKGSGSKASKRKNIGEKLKRTFTGKSETK